MAFICQYTSFFITLYFINFEVGTGNGDGYLSLLNQMDTRYQYSAIIVGNSNVDQVDCGNIVPSPKGYYADTSNTLLQPGIFVKSTDCMAMCVCIKIN